MPNWTENELIIRGPREELDKIYILLKGKCHEEDTEFDFNKVIPYPENFSILDKQSLIKNKIDPKVPHKDGYNQGGYEWCCNNWGTKWNASDPECHDSEDELVYVFNTAWSPSLPVTRKLVEMFPLCSFTHQYWEGGCAFTGTLSGTKGKVDSDVQGNYYGSRGG